MLSHRFLSVLPRENRRRLDYFYYTESLQVNSMSSHDLERCSGQPQAKISSVMPKDHNNELGSIPKVHAGHVQIISKV